MRRLRGAGAAALLLFLGALTTLAFLRHSGVLAPVAPPFADMIEGRAERPFVTRALVPQAVRLLTAATPALVRDGLGRFLSEDRAAAYLLENLKWTPAVDVSAHGAESFWALLLMVLSAAGFFHAVGLLHRALYEEPKSAALSIGAAWVGLFPFFNYGYIYDLTTLWLGALALALLAARRWGAYLVVFTLASINKETAILLTVVSALHAPGRRGFLYAQGAIWLGVRLGIDWAFRDNPGSRVHFHLLDHNLHLLRYWPLATVLAWSALVVLVRTGWREKPLFLRQALVMLPILLAFTLFLGYLDELRDYYEVYPVVLFLALQPLSRLAGSSMVPRPAAPR